MSNIGTLLISSVLQEHGISPREVHFVAIENGFPGTMQAMAQHTSGWQMPCTSSAC